MQLKGSFYGGRGAGPVNNKITMSCGYRKYRKSSKRYNRKGREHYSLNRNKQIDFIVQNAIVMGNRIPKLVVPKIELIFR